MNPFLLHNDSSEACLASIVLRNVSRCSSSKDSKFYLLLIKKYPYINSVIKLFIRLFFSQESTFYFELYSSKKNGIKG